MAKYRFRIGPIIPKLPKIKAPRLLNRSVTPVSEDGEPSQRKIPVQIFRKDPFGNVIILKRMLVSALAMFTYGKFNLINKLNIEGTEYLEDLPQKNVLFISNHQTYYADVMALYHIFCSVKWHFRNSIRLPLYLLMPRANLFYVAAEETMKNSGFFPKILSYTGAVTVKRSWRQQGKDVARGADRNAPEKIKKALEYGWVVTFPQGTTSPYAPVRKGAAHLIKEYNPIVIPVHIDGFRRAFDKKGLRFKKRGVNLKIKFHAPLEYSESDTLEELTKIITAAIGQEEVVEKESESKEEGGKKKEEKNLDGRM